LKIISLYLQYPLLQLGVVVQEVEAGGCELEVILSYTSRPCLKNTKTPKHQDTNNKFTPRWHSSTLFEASGWVRRRTMKHIHFGFSGGLLKD
jgi:hypothetical protein